MDLQKRKTELENERQALISDLFKNEGALTEVTNQLNDQNKSNESVVSN
jgi:hypothetical protein